MHLIHKIQLAACQATDLSIHSHIVMCWKSQQNLMQHKYYISFQCKWIAPKWIHNEHLALRKAELEICPNFWLNIWWETSSKSQGNVLTIILLKKHIEKHIQSICHLKCGNLLFIIIIISTLMAFIYLDWIWF